MFLLVVLAAVVLYFAYSQYQKSLLQYPKGPPGVPFFGNSLQLGRNPLKKSELFQKWGAEYNGMFMLRLPGPVVVLTKFELIKHVLVTLRDSVKYKAANPTFCALNGGDVGLACKVDNQFHRRHIMKVLRNLGVGKHLMESKVSCEIDRLSEYLDELVDSGQANAFDPLQSIQAMQCSIIGSIAYGETYALSDDEGVKATMSLLARWSSLVTLPLTSLLYRLPLMNRIPGTFAKENKEKCASFNKDMTKMMMRIIEERRTELQADGFQLAEQGPDGDFESFLDAYLVEQELERRRHVKEHDQSLIPAYTDVQLAASIKDLLAAGVDTTVKTMSWAFLYWTLNRDVQQKARDEIRDYLHQTGKDRIELADRQYLMYVQAMVYEIYRCSNIVQAFMRCAHEPITVNEQHIPKGTNLAIHIHSVMYDEQMFPQPTVFRPERFLNSEGSLDQSKVERVIIFGMGEAIARTEQFLLICTLLQKFDFKLSEKDSERTEEDLMKRIVGFALRPQPYKLRITHLKLRQK